MVFVGICWVLEVGILDESFEGGRVESLSFGFNGGLWG